MRDLYMLEATGPLSVLAGPVTMAEAMRIVDEHLLPNGWSHRYRPVTPMEEAVKFFTAGRQQRQPIGEADLFVALRRAITCDRDLDGIDDPQVTQLLAHIDPHRPMQMWHGEQECLLGECGIGEGGHTRDAEGACEGMERGERLCVACTVIYDTNSEFGPAFNLRVPWPCSVITAAVGHYQLSGTAGS